MWDEKRIKETVDAQRRFFGSGKTLDADWRKAQLRKLKKSVLAHSDELEDAGVNCPRVTTLSRLLEQPVCVNLDEAEEMVRRLIP